MKHIVISIIASTFLVACSTSKPAEEEEEPAAAQLKQAPASGAESGAESRAGEEGAGFLDREVIQEVVRSHRDQVAFCYEKELQQNPKLQGRIFMNWLIISTGEVVSASVSETTMNHEEVEDCIVAAVSSWVFPEPEGGGFVEVNYPFDFSFD